MEIQSITPTVEEKGMRIDKLLQKHFIDESRTTLQNWIKEGCVCIDDKPVKASRKVEPNEVINVTIPDPVDTTIAPENIPLDVVYEDHELTVQVLSIVSIRKQADS